MNTDLADKHCKPCEGGVIPLQSEQAAELMQGLHAGWRLSDDGREISRRFSFPDALPDFGAAEPSANHANPTATQCLQK